MAVEHTGKGKETPLWWKIFLGFGIALDIKKLLLAAAGIFVTALGWWLLSALFYAMWTEPNFAKFEPNYTSKEDAFKAYKRSLSQYSFLLSLAGPSPTDAESARRVGPGDLAGTFEEYEAILAITGWHSNFGKQVEVKAKEKQLVVGTHTIQLKNEEGELEKLLTGDKAKPWNTTHLKFREDDKSAIDLDGVLLHADQPQQVKELRDTTKSMDQIKSELPGLKDAKKYQTVFEKHREQIEKPKIKPTAKFRTWPWDEDRGRNPYHLVSDAVGATTSGKLEGGGLVHWFFHNQLPVLIEPLIKLVSPVYYLFQPEAGGWNRVYLITIILWSLLVWAYFGGAITRIAVVQVARNEKLSLSEALGFARERLQSFFLAPFFPLFALAVITFLLTIFGLVEGFLPWFGDIILAGLLWPLIILAGLVMVVILVGLFAYPLMSPTISAEGSDSFDALSRSYSYLYQAPWHYLWYCFCALVYGAALVFFVGFMSSMMVYLGKWGMSQAPWLEGPPDKDRTPVYFFMHAPTSFGWRDLLMQDSKYTLDETYIAPSGLPAQRRIFTEEYEKNIGVANRIGAWMVSFWVGLIFMLTLGFGYSYFWTAATIIYLLMRKHVDETDLDEVHLEEEDLALPPLPPASAPPASKPNTLSLNIVDSPPPKPAPEPKPAEPKPPEPKAAEPPAPEPKPD